MNIANEKNCESCMRPCSMKVPPTHSTIHIAKAGSIIVIAGIEAFTRTSRSCAR